MTYGYIRVSSKEQNIDRQIDAFGKMKVERGNIYVDRQSGKDFDRPAYKRLLRKLKKDDLLVAKSIDRLGRNYDEILEQWRLITKVKQADIYIIDFPLLDTRSKDKDLTGTFVADLVLQILSYVAQTERDFIRQRQAEGIACAKQRGVQFGRAEVILPDNFYEAASKLKSKELTVRKAAEFCDMNYSTFYKKYREMEL